MLNSQHRAQPGPFPIVLASRNPGKAREIRAILAPLGVEVSSLGEVDPAGDIPEPAETGSTFAANARAKARYYARAFGCWALADDSGLEVKALGGAPGVRSARYSADDCAGGGATPGREQMDSANNEKLLLELAEVPEAERSARFVCHLCLSDGRGTALEADGTIEGRIAQHPAGRSGFGYDPLFFVPALGCTMAQLPPEKKNEISHRGRASREFARRLSQWLSAGKGRPSCPS